MDNQKKAKLEDSFESAFNTEILTLPETTMGDSCIQHLDTFPLFSLPEIALGKVLSYLSYDQLAQMRVICKNMDWICQVHLNRGFRLAEQFHAKCLKEVRSKLPRRESSRREHPYSRHCDILTAIGTRISLLAMTFCKFIDVELCCFIPGRVIDELFRVLRICNEKNPPRAFEVLQELRDISSMAMEHFDEKIVPTFKVNPQSPAAAAIAVVTTCGHNSVTPSKILSGSFMSMSGPSYLGVPSISSPVFGSTNSTPKGSVNSKSFNKGLLFNETGEIDTGSVISKIKSIEKNLQEKVDKNHKALQTTIKRQRRMMKKMKNEMSVQKGKIAGLEKIVSSQETIIVNQTEKLKEHDTLFAELSKLPKEQGKLDILPCSDKSIIKNAYCESLVNECSKYIPQFIIQPPTNTSDVKNINSLTVEKKQVSKCSKRKIQSHTDEHYSEPQRKRTKDLEADLAILEWTEMNM